jgi:hypothetical protein
MVWYGVARSCDECKTEGNLYQLAFSADGELHFSFYCPKCKKPFHWRIFATQLAHDAMCRDLMKCHHSKKVVPVANPPIITPEDFTEEDLKLFKLMNITPPKKEKPN